MLELLPIPLLHACHALQALNSPRYLLHNTRYLNTNSIINWKSEVSIGRPNTIAAEDTRCSVHLVRHLFQVGLLCYRLKETTFTLFVLHGSDFTKINIHSCEICCYETQNIILEFFTKDSNLYTCKKTFVLKSETVVKLQNT